MDQSPTADEQDADAEPEQRGVDGDLNACVVAPARWRPKQIRQLIPRRKKQGPPFGEPLFEVS
jgi:hypothetical protein